MAQVNPYRVDAGRKGGYVVVDERGRVVGAHRSYAAANAMKKKLSRMEPRGFFRGFRKGLGMAGNPRRGKAGSGYYIADDDFVLGLGADGFTQLRRRTKRGVPSGSIKFGSPEAAERELSVLRGGHHWPGFTPGASVVRRNPIYHYKHRYDSKQPWQRSEVFAEDYDFATQLMMKRHPDEMIDLDEIQHIDVSGVRVIGPGGRYKMKRKVWRGPRRKGRGMARNPRRSGTREYERLSRYYSGQDVRPGRAAGAGYYRTKKSAEEAAAAMAGATGKKWGVFRKRGGARRFMVDPVSEHRGKRSLATFYRGSKRRSSGRQTKRNPHFSMLEHFLGVKPKDIPSEGLPWREVVRRRRKQRKASPRGRIVRGKGRSSGRQTKRRNPIYHYKRRPRNSKGQFIKVKRNRSKRR